MSYETDEEKVEAIKKWWRENGVAVVAGIVIGLGGIIGWRWWGDYRDSVAAEASAIFDQVMVNAAAGQTEALAAQTRRLREDYGTTPYPALAALIEAKALYESGQANEAMVALQQARDAAPDPALAHLAALRLARIQLAEGQLDAAAKTIAGLETTPAFAGEVAAVRGDLAVARGDHAAAREAYQERSPAVLVCLS